MTGPWFAIGWLLTWSHFQTSRGTPRSWTVEEAPTARPAVPIAYTR